MERIMKSGEFNIERNDHNHNEIGNIERSAAGQERTDGGGGKDAVVEEQHGVRIPIAHNSLSDVVPISNVAPNATEAKKPDRLKRFLKKK